MFACALLLVFAAGALNAQVTFDRILRADKEPQNWLTYSGSVLGQQYSPLAQVTPANVNSLQLQWAFQARSLEKFESTPLVVDGMMYVTQAPNDVVALNAASGEIKWIYSYSPSKEARPCCGRVNRGVAILGNTLFMATIDADLLAPLPRHGNVFWDIGVAKAEACYSIAFAPLRLEGHGTVPLGAR